MRVLAAASGIGVLTFVLAVVFWPTRRSGPEPIAWGRDACAHCRMHLTQPGFAGEMRDHSGTLTKYDDIGCLVRAMVEKRGQIPEAWVEDHDSGRLVPLLTATLVRGQGTTTPMGSGVVAFGDEAAAGAFARAHEGEPVRLEDLARESAGAGRGETR